MTKVAIVDYGMGNLFSVKHAFEHIDIPTIISSDWKEIIDSDMVLIPGVGAFGDAMKTLHALDLVKPLQDIAYSDKLLVGICLGMQLLMTESYEFGHHKGLDIIDGAVIPIEAKNSDGSPAKTPHIGWNRIYSPNQKADIWSDTPLSKQSQGNYFYFVHSFHVSPTDQDIVNSISKYENIEFCSSLWKNRVFGCQFHPERSGTNGLSIYKTIAELINPNNTKAHIV